jgi:hypothetical protein
MGVHLLDLPKGRYIWFHLELVRRLTGGCLGLLKLSSQAKLSPQALPRNLWHCHHAGWRLRSWQDVYSAGIANRFHLGVYTEQLVPAARRAVMGRIWRCYLCLVRRGCD